MCNCLYYIVIHMYGGSNFSIDHYRIPAICHVPKAHGEGHKAHSCRFTVRGPRRTLDGDQPRQQRPLRHVPFIGHMAKKFAVC